MGGCSFPERRSGRPPFDGWTTFAGRHPLVNADSAVEITLIVPVHEEESNIVQLFTEIDEKIEYPHQVLIIYDHDHDSTLNKKAELEQRYPNIRFIRNAHGRGIINAFKTGFENANTEYLVPIMADLSDMPETVNHMYGKIKEGADLVIASRYIEGGAKIGGPALKRVLSRLGNYSLQKLSGMPVHDMTNAFIMYRRKVIDNIEIESTGGFEITMEIIAKAYFNGARISEVPTVNRDRIGGVSKFKLMAWIVKYLYWYVYVLYHATAKKISSVFSPRP